MSFTLLVALVACSDGTEPDTVEAVADSRGSVADTLGDADVPAADDLGTTATEDVTTSAPDVSASNDAQSPPPDDTASADDIASAEDTVGVEDVLVPDDLGTAEDIGVSEDLGGSVDVGVAPDAAPPENDAGPAGPTTALSCFQDQMPDGVLLVDYDECTPTVGSHCKGTNHQDIAGVERVIFAGDSITVGTPPTATEDYYRNLMADELAAKFGLEAPGWGWQNVNVINGITLEQTSGDFASCAKWSARTDDIGKPPHQQLQTCAEGHQDKVTLIVMTVGGNDLFAWAQDLIEGFPLEDLWTEAEEAVIDLENALDWALLPDSFPNGVYVVFANTYEFSDADSGKDLANCPGAGFIGMDWALIDPGFMELARYLNKEMMRITTERGIDLVFFGETTCGHGHMKDDPEGRCYKGPNTELWFHLTCMHPSGAGHAGIADMFMAVINE